MHRRFFFLVTGQALAFALAARTARAVALRGEASSQTSSTEIEQRVASVLQAFDVQGNHRSGTSVDNASAEWLSLSRTTPTDDQARGSMDLYRL